MTYSKSKLIIYEEIQWIDFHPRKSFTSFVITSKLSQNAAIRQDKPLFQLNGFTIQKMRPLKRNSSWKSFTYK